MEEDDTDSGKNGSLNDTELLNVLEALTSQKTSIKLIKELKWLLEARLSCSRVEIFEIRTIRDADARKPEYRVSLDALNPERGAVETKKLEGFEEALSRKSIVKDGQEGCKRMLVPLVASNTSHMAVFYYCDLDESAVKRIFNSFGNLLDLLRSRDRDPLTGFLNRYAFDRSMSEMALNSPGNPDYAVDKRPYTALAMLDLDNFKHVNDNYGHIIGDETLLIFSQEISLVFRHSDIITRYGGEEFVVIMKDIDAEEAFLVLERCRLKVAERIFPQIEHITVSIGFAAVSGLFSPMLALDRADKALYYAKNNGRNRVCSYESLLAEEKITPLHEKGSDIELWD